MKGICGVSCGPSRLEQCLHAHEILVQTVRSQGAPRAYVRQPRPSGAWFARLVVLSHGRS